jgi:hypothetical protein
MIRDFAREVDGIIDSIQSALKGGKVGPKAEQFTTKLADMLKSKV